MMSNVIFRTMTADDADVVAELDCECFGVRDAWSREDFLAVANDKRFKFIVAEECGKIIACAGAEIYFDTAEIESISVAAEYRRRGVGKMLLVKLIAAIMERGATFIVLQVRPSNEPAIKLYKDFGFQIVDRAENFYGDEDAWIMAREFGRVDDE